MADPIFSIRVTHSGQYADGRPNTQSILINDLDTGIQYQNRKVPVYVPAGGFIDIPLTSWSLFSVEQGTISKLIEAGMVTIQTSVPTFGTGSGVVVVDSNSTAAVEDGTWAYPWKTLQRGINALWGDVNDAFPASPTVFGDPRVIYILPGQYRENIVLPTAGKITLIGMGVIAIGLPGVHTLTRVSDPANNAEAPNRPTLYLTGFTPQDGVYIFSDITLADVGAGQAQNLYLDNSGFFGVVDGTGMTAAIGMIATTGTRFVTPTWNTPTMAISCQDTSWFVGTPIIDYFFKVEHCLFNQGFTIASDPTPVIFIDTQIAGTVTSPVNFRVDYFTNGVMAANAVVKAGGWAATIPVGQAAPY